MPLIKKHPELQREEQLDRKIKLSEDNVIEPVLLELEQAKTQLQELRNKRIEGIAIRSRVKWINEGEKVTKYFCNFENSNYLDKAMPHFIEKNNGEMVSQQGRILNEVKQFYEELYCYRQVKDIDLKGLSGPHISHGC